MTNARTKINRSDLKIFPSERLTDNDDGGGMPTGTPIRGVANELFNPISSIARINGGFFTRLVYAGVERADDEPLIGAFTAITKPPKDKSVSYLLFPATKFGESRAEILKRIEAHSVPTIESRMALLSTQASNSKLVQSYQRVGEPLPLVGDRYCLKQDKKGYPYAEQFIQVTKVSAEDRTFINPQTGKEFVRTVVKMEITQPLEHDFIGIDYPSEGYADNPCKIRETHVADAGQYYGVKPLTKAIEANEMKIAVPSLMDKIIPTNQIETRLADLTASGHRQTLFDGSSELVSLAVALSHTAGAINRLYAGNAILPNSVQLTANKGVISDKGGTLYQNEVAIGTVDYGAGELLINEPTFVDYLQNLTFRPASNDRQVADTMAIDITINNRSYGYVKTLDPIPAIGTLQVSYRSQGRWYELIDGGDGVLRGASQSHGSGSINFVTGTVQFSCGELPDVGSAIILSWGTKARYFNRSGQSVPAHVVLQLDKDADPASIRLSWGGNKTATVNANGVLSGDWSGQYDSQTNRLLIDVQANPPDGVQEVKVDYNFGEKKYQHHKAPLRDGLGKITLDLGDVPIVPNSVRLRWNLLIEDYEVITEGDVQVRFVDPYKTVRDDGRGKLVDEKGVEVGTIDYTGRRLTFSPDTTVQIPKAKYIKTKEGEQIISVEGNKTTFKPIYRNIFAGYDYVPAGASMPIDESAFAEVWFFDTGTSQASQTLGTKSVEIDVLPNYAEVVAPSSLHMLWGGKRYFDKAGQIFTDLNPKTGEALKVGTIDYATGKLLLDVWHAGNATITSLVTSITGNPVDAVAFCTVASPIRPSSLQVRAVAVDGKRINVTANEKGELIGDGVQGFVDVEFGVVRVNFGQFVDDEWQSLPVFAHTLTYNAVTYSYLPVAGDVVKIDTVRLPHDGRVPIFRRGDTILISNTVEQDLGSAFTGLQTVQLDRTDLDRICLQDSNGKAVNAELWDYDLKAGSITFAGALDLSDYQMPLIAKHTHEEKNRVIEVDIDGTLSLQFATKRAYPLENTYVSSVLIGDDLQVRATVPFTQRNWNNVWQDFPNGEQLLNKLNVKDYPIVLTDDGAITERWVIIFKGNQFELYGETLGFVLKSDTLQDLAPINPATKKPYFTIPKQAFGNDAPWAVQDVIRFNTEGTLMPVWVLCAVQPTASPLNEEDGFTMCLFGDTTEI